MTKGPSGNMKTKIQQKSSKVQGGIAEHRFCNQTEVGSNPVSATWHICNLKKSSNISEPVSSFVNSTYFRGLS